MTPFNDVLKQEVFQQIHQAAQNLSVQTYLVGGFVRNLLLKRPSKDIDIVCVGSGIELASEFSALSDKASELIVFKNFGTARVHLGKWEVEFVGARKESYRRDSRNPIVENGTLEDDQKRRDFTINALALSLNKNDFGKLIDPFGGIKHLKSKTIQTPLNPDITFSDDPLRMMRAVRFATQLDFNIAPDTFDSITKNVERIEVVSKERIIDELNKIILSPTPSYGFKLLFRCGLLKLIFPEITELHGVEVIQGKKHKDNFYHTLQVLDNIAKTDDNLWLRWAAILHDIAKPIMQRFDPTIGWTFYGHEDKGARMVPKIFKKMKLPLNEKMKYVQKLVKLHLRPIALTIDETTDSAVRRIIFEAGEDLEDLMKLCRADITSKNPDKVKRYMKNFDQVEKKMNELEERDNLRNFQPPISGNHIMKELNLAPGREVGKIKQEIREAILDGLIPNKVNDAHKLMLNIAKRKKLLK